MRDVRWGHARLYQQGGQVLMGYQDGHYKPYSPPEFHTQLATCSNEDITRLGIREWRLITDTTFPIVPSFKPPPARRVCLLNGTFDLDDGALHDWDKNDFLISQLPFTYNPDATCPIYEKFLSETFAPMDGEDESERELAIQCFEEFVAMTMVECHDYHRFLVLEGSTRSGKSVLTRVAALMHDPDAVSSVMAHDFGDERYRAAMMGKLINITGETSTVNSVADDFLKMIVGGERVSVRHLYRPVSSVVLPTRLLIATNDPLKTKDTSNAVMERMLVLRCDNYRPPDKRDTQLPKKLETEREGIFLRMVAAWQRLRERGDFELPASSKVMREEFVVGNNVVLAWIRDNTHQGRMFDDPAYELPNGVAEYTEVKVLFSDFDFWCEQLNYAKRSFNTFCKELGKIRIEGFDFNNVIKRVGGSSGTPVRCRMLSIVKTTRY
jgi:P4 family phage/plasmid primase-like protien